MTKEECLKRIKELEEKIQKKHEKIDELSAEIVDVEISICNDARMIDSLHYEMENEYS